MNWNKHEKLLGMSERDLLVYLRQRGFVFVREHYVFGRMLTFQDVESGVRKWYVEGGLRDWPEVCGWLRENWRPVGREEQDWFVVNLGEKDP